MSYNIVKAADLRAIGVPVNEEAEPTVLAHKRQMAEIAAVPNFVKNVCRCPICGANVDREYSILVCQNNPAHIGDSGTGIVTDHSYPKSKR